jgi:DNA-binding transcriptional LysR family regulator
MALLVRGGGLRLPVRPAGEVLFDGNAMAMQAVPDGVGIAVAQLAYVGDALATGRLVAPIPIVARKRESWFLEYRPICREDPALAGIPRLAARRSRAATPSRSRVAKTNCQSGVTKTEARTVVTI